MAIGTPPTSPPRVSARRPRRDVFISYSRTDGVWVKTLHERLAASGMTVYRDVRDIHASSPDWQADIRAQIEASDTVVAVLSPAALASESVEFEIAHAVALGKRLTPVLVRDVDARELPKAVRKPQWIDFRDERAFEARFKVLHAVLKTDVEWVQEHTGHLQDAVQWQGLDNDYRPSRLLRGDVRRKAEDWLGRQAGKDPPPTDLQIRFIVASRRHAAKLQRRVFAAVVVVLVVAIGLTVFALFQRREALEQRDRALSRSLAIQALDHVDEDIDLAAQLSLEAYDKEPTFEARNAVLSALHSDLRRRAAFTAHEDWVHDVAFSADSRTLASAGEDGRVRLWDVSGKPRPRGRPLGYGETINAVAFSPDGLILASAGAHFYGSDIIQLWDSRTGRRLGRVLSESGVVSDIAFSPDGATLAVADGGNVRLLDASTRRRRGRPLGGHGEFVHTVAFSPDGGTLASGGDNRLVRLWDVATSRPLGRPLEGHARAVYSVAFSPDGRTLASGSDSVRLWDVSAGRQLGEPLRGTIGIVDSLAFGLDGGTIAAVDGDTVRLWDVRTRGQLGPPLRGHGDLVNSVAVSPDGKTLASAGDDYTVRLWDLAGPPRGEPLTDHGLGSERAVFSPDGKSLASAGGDDGRAWLWDLSARRPRGRAFQGRSYFVADLAFSPDGTTLASGDGFGFVQLWDVRTRRRRGEQFLVDDGSVNGLAFSTDSRILATAGDDGSVRLWDVGSRRQRGRRLRIRSDAVYNWANSVAFSPDGRTLASAGGGGTVRLWDVRSEHPHGRPLTGHTDEIMSLAFSRDGATLATGGEAGTLRLWDVGTGRPLGQPLMGHTNWIESVAFSPDGTTLASAGLDGTMRLWDVPTQRPLGRALKNPAGAVTSVAFSPDGGTLASAGGGPVRLWDAILWSDNGHALGDRLCERVSRSLSRAEWSEFVPGEPYRETCDA